MSQSSEDSARARVSALIKSNLTTLIGNLNNFWTRFAEDMIGGDVSRADIGESLFTVGLTYKLASDGKTETARHLRAIADFIERSVDERPAGHA